MLFKKRKFNYFILIALLAGAFYTWLAVFKQAPDNILKVHFFDVGQGDSIFIETPQGKQVLIDGGPDKMILEKLGETMPFYDRSIDLVILTHPDADHITGLAEVLKFYQIDHILSSGFEKDTAVYHKWRGLIEEKDIPLTLARNGQQIFLEKGIVMKILWPEQSLMNSMVKNANDASVVGQLIYGQIEILLTGDIEKNIEQYLVTHLPAGGLESDIFKAPHHGSKTSTSYNFLKAVNPQIAVISVGLDNRYGHPHKDILERLKYISVYRTDLMGDVEILTDGNLLKTRTEK
jgi:competence protein ComEC